MEPDESEHKRKLDKVMKKQQESMKKYGWIMHFVMDDDDFPNGINYHTHGLKENFSHPDIQICLPIAPELAHSVISGVVKRIKEGKTYEPYQEYYDVFDGRFKAVFVEANNDNQGILRLIFPDENNGYDAPLYKDQFTKLHLTKSNDQAEEMKSTRRKPPPR